MGKPSIPLPTFSEDKIKLFWSRVGIGAEDECWPWQKARSVNKKGERTYGVFSPNLTQSIAAHRIAYFLSTGDDPHGFVVMHSCDNPPCCNPKHLTKGSYADNIRDAQRKGRLAFGDRNHSRLHPEKLKRGTAHPNARLTEAKVIAIRLAYANGARICDLATTYNVARGTIGFVVKRQVWRHI